MAIKKTAIKWSEYIKNEIIETSCLSAYAKYLQKANDDQKQRQSQLHPAQQVCVYSTTVL